MSKHNSLTIMLLLVCSSISFSQNFTELKEYALRDAKITSQATLKMDFETVLKYTHPGVISLMGGHDKGLEMVKSIFDGMLSQGFVFEKADVLNASDVVFEQNEYRCSIEGFNQFKMSGMRIKSKSYLLGIYNETNKFWYFIEAKQLKNKTMLDMVLPNFKTSLIIPDDDIVTEIIQD
jgi:hypothetical protein